MTEPCTILRYPAFCEGDDTESRESRKLINILIAAGGLDISIDNMRLGDIRCKPNDMLRMQFGRLMFRWHQAVQRSIEQDRNVDRDKQSISFCSGEAVYAKMIPTSTTEDKEGYFFFRAKSVIAV